MGARGSNVLAQVTDGHTISTMDPLNLFFNPPENARLHWNYFLALEKDLEQISRYIEFCPANFDTYSIELAHLLLSAASEVDTLAKCICNILSPSKKAEKINQYRDVIRSSEETETYPFLVGKKNAPIAAEKHKKRLSALKVYIPRYSLEFAPWASWAEDETPDWWHSYNRVKHERNRFFSEATLNNALHAVAALLALNYVHFRLEITKTNPQDRYHCWGKTITRRMRPEPALMRFGINFYEISQAAFESYLRSMSEDE